MAKKTVKLTGKPTTWIIIVAVLVLLSFILTYILKMKKTKTGRENEELEMEEFEEKTKISVIYAYSNSCPHCTKFQNTFDVKSKEFANSINDMNVEIFKFEKASLPVKYANQIDGFPTVLIYKDGQFMKKTVGNMGAEDFLKSLHAAIH